MSNVTSFPDLGSELTGKIIEAGLSVHKHFGPGLLENIYEECLFVELVEMGFLVKKQQIMPITYKGKNLENAYRLDLWVENKIVIEIKAVDKLLPIHEAQILTYMRLSKSPLGLLINFNERLLKDGIKRFALSHLAQ